MRFYILRLKLCGIKNIEEPITIEFYKKTINNDFNPEKYRIKAIYGENGSGKTAIITAVKLMRSILTDGNYLLDNDTQRSLVELVNKKTRNGNIECEFYTDLDVKRIMHYSLSFEIGADERFYITEELLEEKNGNRSSNKYQNVIRTMKGTLVDCLDTNVKEYFKDKTMNLLDKQSLSTIVIRQFDMPMELRTTSTILYLFILTIFALTIDVFLDEADNHADYALRERISELDEKTIESKGAELVQQINKKIINPKADTKKIPKSNYASYEEQTRRLCDFVKIFKPELKEIEIEKRDLDTYYQCNLKMVYENYTLDREFESRGIKKLMDLFDTLDAASSGAVVFIDELDSNVNDVYLDKLIEYFACYGKGQLCFTAHNLSPMTVLKSNRNAISFISSINTVHTWTSNGNYTPENAYRNGFIEDSPFNVDATDFLGILGGQNA
ncbi:MAG: ATP-binding protein [Lachnospiraceae bacterium]|nr:ATP-binding protein [Lachnospiraceae bacterium]